MMEIYNCEQYSPEWYALRLGSIGGSNISDVVAGGKGKMRKNLMYRLTGEILSGQNYEGYSNAHMERGIEQEPEARAMYEFATGYEVEQIGTVKEGNNKHYSPDGLVGKTGIVEIKCVIPSVHIETIHTEKIDGGYYKQIQWGLFICQRDWADFISYSPLVIDIPIWVKRFSRDPETIKELNEGADKFIQEMALTIRKLKELK